MIPPFWIWSGRFINAGAGRNSNPYGWRPSIGQGQRYACHPVPEGWISGNFDFFDYQRPIELLRKGVIDTWVASYPDIPDHDDVEIASIRLNRILLS